MSCFGRCVAMSIETGGLVEASVPQEHSTGEKSRTRMEFGKLLLRGAVGRVLAAYLVHIASILALEVSSVQTCLVFSWV